MFFSLGVGLILFFILLKTTIILMLYRLGMQKEWAEISTTFMNHVGSEYGQSVKVSLMAGELVVVEIDEKLLPKFKRAEEKKERFTELEFWQQEECQVTKYDCQKSSRSVRKELQGYLQVSSHMLLMLQA